MTHPAKGAARAAPEPKSAVVYDQRPYHERRAEMARCPECGDPRCYSLVCDEPPGSDR